MKKDSRMFAALHALLHMAERTEPMTSEELALCLSTNPVVVRRTLGLLREAGMVASVRGHSGGWYLKTDLSNVSLRQLHEALGAPALFAMGNRRENPACLVEQAVNAALNDAFDEAETLLLERLASVSLADLAADFERRYKTHMKQEIS